jgi:hypothetical protein
VACGDLSGYDNGGIDFLDSDKSYPIFQSAVSSDNQSDDVYIKPIAPPIKPPYENSIAKAKEERQKKSKASI